MVNPSVNHSEKGNELSSDSEYKHCSPIRKSDPLKEETSKREEYSERQSSNITNTAGAPADRVSAMHPNLSASIEEDRPKGIKLNQPDQIFERYNRFHADIWELGTSADNHEGPPTMYKRRAGLRKKERKRQVR